MTTKILVAQFAHETNTFSERPTDLAAFRARFWAEGSDVLDQFQNTNSEIAGFLDICEAYGFEPIPVIATAAGPSGLVTADVVDLVTRKITDAIRTRKPVGLMLALHGAMVTEQDFDGEGDLLEAVRQVAGEDIPIAATLDLHANVSDRMAALADILVSYRTYPHTDMRETGYRAGKLLAHALQEGPRLRTVVARRRLLEGCDDGRTGVDGQMDVLLAMASDLMREDGVFDVSINSGFADADIPFSGPTVTVTGNKEKQHLQGIADSMMSEVWDRRDDWSVAFLDPADAVTRALSATSASSPVVIADYADNPGGGGYGDATNLLRAMLDCDVGNAAFGALFDPEAVSVMTQAGVGSTVNLPIGGKTDPEKGGGPIQVEGLVTALSDGTFIFKGPMSTGTVGYLGQCATLRVAGVDILVGSVNTQMLDMEIFRMAGIEPTEKSVVAVKSMHHFRGSFGPIASQVLVCDTGALCSPDRTRMTYRHVRRPIYPLDPAELCK